LLTNALVALHQRDYSYFTFRGGSQSRAALRAAAKRETHFASDSHHFNEKGDPHMKRTASARWTGDLKQGKGTLTTPSGVLSETPYSFTTRFEDAKGTNPEELIAAAHAGCFTMALSAFLGRAGFTPQQLATQATLTLEQVQGNWTITTIHLEVNARVPNIGREKFVEIAADAKANCPVSRLLKATITLDAKLETT
jgi:osmotically inducible protein OsmC